ncbi:MAG: hypothetical protein ACI8ZN_001136 [Bacteroidia bacterium]|jgi:hypothetical protein
MKRTNHTLRPHLFRSGLAFVTLVVLLSSTTKGTANHRFKLYGSNQLDLRLHTNIIWRGVENQIKIYDDTLKLYVNQNAILSFQSDLINDPKWNSEIKAFEFFVDSIIHKDTLVLYVNSNGNLDTFSLLLLDIPLPYLVIRGWPNYHQPVLKLDSIVAYEGYLKHPRSAGYSCIYTIQSFEILILDGVGGVKYFEKQLGNKFSRELYLSAHQYPFKSTIILRNVVVHGSNGKTYLCEQKFINGERGE